MLNDKLSLQLMSKLFTVISRTLLTNSQTNNIMAKSKHRIVFRHQAAATLAIPVVSVINFLINPSSPTKLCTLFVNKAYNACNYLLNCGRLLISICLLIYLSEKEYLIASIALLHSCTVSSGSLVTLPSLSTLNK